jgi:hypothetical protein
MIRLSLFLVLNLAGVLASAIPVESIQSTHKLFKRNVCDMNDLSSTPAMYVEYRQDVCPPTYVMDANLNCPYDLGSVGNLNPQCETFCQVRKITLYLLLTLSLE